MTDETKTNLAALHDDLERAEMRATIAAEQAAETIRLRHDAIDSELSRQAAIRDAGIEAIRSKLRAMDEKIDAARAEEKRFDLAFDDANTDQAIASGGAKAIEARNQSEIALRRSIVAREALQAERIGIEGELHAAVCEPQPRDPRGYPIMRALAVVPALRANHVERVALEKSALALVGDDETGRNVVLSAINASAFLAMPGATATASQDAAHDLCRGLANLVNASGPLDLSHASLTRYLEAFCEGSYSIIIRRELDERNARGVRQAALFAADEARREGERRLEKLQERVRDISVAIARERNGSVMRGPLTSPGVLEAELAGVVAELAILEKKTIPDLGTSRAGASP